MGLDQIISVFQNTNLPLWCHQPFTSCRQGWLDRGFLQYASICLALYHCYMTLFTKRWHPFIIVLTCGGALPSSFPINYKFYFIHLLILRSQDHFYKRPMQLKELVSVFFLNLCFNNIQLYLQRFTSSLILWNGSFAYYDFSLGSSWFLFGWLLCFDIGPPFSRWWTEN